MALKSSLRHRNRRLNRRIPVVSSAAIVLKSGQRIDAQCVELGVGGLALHADYVPREEEQLRVEVYPSESAATFSTLVADVVVRRCHPLEDGRYEIGCEIVQIVR